jgi:hypothetical protein
MVKLLPIGRDEKLCLFVYIFFIYALKFMPFGQLLSRDFNIPMSFSQGIYQGSGRTSLRNGFSL